MYHLYILKSLNTSEYYKGIAKNLDLRLYQHFQGKVRFTKSRFPLKLVHVEICETRQEAIRLEKFFKSGYGREIIKELFN